MDSTQRARAILSFVQAADTGSFAAASRQLGISGAAVSKNVAALEKALGVRLMNRTTRNLSLTEEGSTFLMHARLALEALDSAVAAVTQPRERVSGRVRISVISSFGRGWLLPKLPALLARYPGLVVDVDFDDRVVDLVREGFDLVFRGGTIPDSSFAARLVCPLHMVVVAAPGYLESRGIPSTPEDLKNHRLVARRFLGGKMLPWSFRDREGNLFTFDPAGAITLTLSDPEAAVLAARDGVGIAHVGLHLAWPFLESGELRVVLNDWHDPGTLELYMLFPHRALIAPRVRVTLDYFIEAFSADKSLHRTLKQISDFAV